MNKYSNNEEWNGPDFSNRYWIVKTIFQGIRDIEIKKHILANPEEQAKLDASLKVAFDIVNTAKTISR